MTVVFLKKMDLNIVPPGNFLLYTLSRLPLVSVLPSLPFSSFSWCEGWCRKVVVHGIFNKAEFGVALFFMRGPKVGPMSQ